MRWTNDHGTALQPCADDDDYADDSDYATALHNHPHARALSLAHFGSILVQICWGVRVGSLRTHMHALATDFFSLTVLTAPCTVLPVLSCHSCAHETQQGRYRVTPPGGPAP